MKLKYSSPPFINIDGWQVEWPIPPRYASTKYPVEVKKKARLYNKGLKILFKEAGKKGFFERIGEQIHGNANDVLSKYDKLLRCCSVDSIIAIGSGLNFSVQSYVDGSYTVETKSSFDLFREKI